VNKEKVRLKLNALLNAQFGDDIPAFCKATGLHYANVQKVYSSTSESLPSFTNIEKWVRACGSTMSQFCADLEAEESGQESIPEHPLLIQARALISRDAEAARLMADLFGRLAPKSPPRRKQH
jgi:hypothetical protein